jgi:hypothetical protein
MGTGIKERKSSSPVTVNDIAPTLAEILKVARPAGAGGRVLQEILD